MACGYEGCVTLGACEAWDPKQVCAAGDWAVAVLSTDFAYPLIQFGLFLRACSVPKVPGVSVEGTPGPTGWTTVGETDWNRPQHPERCPGPARCSLSTRRMNE